MSYYIYILYSPTAGTFYKGQTEDIKNRLQRHNSGFEKATARYVPWQLLWYTEKQNRSEAVLLETKLKNLSRDRTLQFMLKYDEGIAGADELFLIKQLSAC